MRDISREAEHNGLPEIPQELLDFVEKETGLPRRTIMRVLVAERRYYLLLLID